MMRRYLSVILLAIMAFSGVMAQEVTMEECEQIRIGQKAPHYYCACHFESDTFQFPLDTVVRDTIWLTATMNDIRKGISAYWFSDDTVTIEIYTFCTDKVPLMSLTLGGNRMREVDAAEVQEQMDKMPQDIMATLSLITPHLRVYPQGKGFGRVCCYPYDQGPKSTCEAPLPLMQGMTYVCDEEENAFRLDSAHISPEGEGFLHWKQRQNMPCEIRLTYDSCGGEEIDRATLSDSLHVYMLDSATLVQAREANRRIWLQVKHEAGKPGRITYYAQETYAEPAEPLTDGTCMGKALDVNLREYTRDTAFIDTIWLSKDTLQAMKVNLTFTEPKTEYDTLFVEYKELRAGYRSTKYNITFYQYGDTLLEIAQPTTCTRRVLLSIREPQAIGDIKSTPKARKQIQEGKIFILVDDKKYNVLGQELKAENKTNNQ